MPNLDQLSEWAPIPDELYNKLANEGYDAAYGDEVSGQNAPYPKESAMEEKIKKIISKFDFQHVQSHMESVGWTYWDTDGKTPTIDKLILTALKCLRKVTATDTDTLISSTGRFTAINITYPCGTKDLILMFTIEMDNETY